MKFLRLLSFLAIGLSLLSSDFTYAQTTATIGTGSSSSSTRGPFQRADTNSTTVFSRWIQVFTPAELANAGLTSGVSISQLNWDAGSSNNIIGSGNAYLKIYVKNSSDTSATTGAWATLITGSTEVFNDSFNTTNNFPGVKDWIPFAFSTPFTYTGGMLEIAVDWDCSQVSTPAFGGNGALKFYWHDTPNHNYAVKKTASSSPPSSLTDLKDERANIQIVFNAAGCPSPTALHTNNATATTADLNWGAATGATSYNWTVVLAGAGSAGTAVSSGTSANTTVTATGLSPLTAYDFFVDADCGATGTSGFEGPYSFLSSGTNQNVFSIGAGTSSSSTRGPYQRADTNSSTVFSRWVQIFTASELATAGVVNGDMITQLNWELASSNVIIGNGDAVLQVYIKNSAATAATSDTWANYVSGSALVVDNHYNTVNNYPGANGWMPHSFTTPFTYTGGTIEIAVDWDCSNVSTPAFSGNGALKFRWHATSPDDLVAKKTASSSAPSTLSDLKDERANIQFVTSFNKCSMPVSLNAANIGITSADLSWVDSVATSFKWKVVLEGASVLAAGIDSATTSNNTATTTMLIGATSYDLYVEADCGATGLSEFAGPITFKTQCAATPATAITPAIIDVACNGGNDGTIDLTVTAGVPGYTYSWSNGDTTKDISGLAAGSYSVTITDGDGCPFFDTLTVVEPTALVLAATSVSDTTNAGLGSASITVSGGTSPYTYTWDGTAGDADSTGLASGTYNVVITDANGCMDSVDVVVDNFNVSISQIDYLEKLSISPNPTNGMATIDLALTQHAEVGISIYAITGKLIVAFAQENTNHVKREIDLSAYANGMYFIRVAINKQVTTKKLVIQK